jgi:hypothetical protein
MEDEEPEEDVEMEDNYESECVRAAETDGIARTGETGDDENEEDEIFGAGSGEESSSDGDSDGDGDSNIDEDIFIEDLYEP